MKSKEVIIGTRVMGGDNPILIQTMCNTHTSDIEKSFEQCKAAYYKGADLIRLTVPSLKDVENLKIIHDKLRAADIDIPLIADVHFSSEIALACAKVVEKVRINPGNFHKNHEIACSKFGELVRLCKEYNTAIRIGINHGSLGERITNLYGNTPLAMKEAMMEWIELCIKNDFYNVVLSLKASNTIVMVQAYRLLAEEMEKRGLSFPLHLGVTEAGNGISGRIKSAIGVSSLLSEGIGDTIRVSLTEDPLNEIPVARHIANRYNKLINSSLIGLKIECKRIEASYNSPNEEELILDIACDFGKRLLDKEFDELVISGSCEGKEIDKAWAENIVDECLQGARRKFYRAEFIACPGCGRTMFNLEAKFNEVKRRTAHLKDTVIAVMGCIVNGPGEMADADWGYVGEGNKKVSIYKGRQAVLKHIPEDEAIDKLLYLIETEKQPQ